ncbi:Gfo/Idh/MocA family protein [Paenibacillus sp. SI92]
MAFKICAIGCGSIAIKGHGPAYRQYASKHPDVELAACVDTNSLRAAEFAARFGFQRSYTDLDAALDLEQPDAVCLHVPAPLIADLAVRILRKGYPLLLEKPPGISKDEVLQIADATERNGSVRLPTQVAFNRRYMPISLRVKEQVAEWNRNGKLHHISYDMYRVGRTDSEDASVTAIHGIDAMKFWAESEYEEIRFRYTKLGHLGPNVTNVSLEGRFVSGVTCQLNYFPVSGAVLERVAIIGETQTMFVNLPFWSSHDSPGSVQCYQNNQMQEQWDGLALAGTEDAFVTNGFYAENESFFDDLRARKQPVGDIRSAIQSVEIAACILQRREKYRL